MSITNISSPHEPDVVDTDISNQTWYTMYNKSKEIAANSNVTTTMIWGSQWDAVLRWMYNSGDNDKKTYTYNSAEQGNYEIEGIPTGSNVKYAVNNIYDMAGNKFDWTIETRTSHYRIFRGGIGYYGGTTSASYRYNQGGQLGSNGGSSLYGCRLAMHIK